MNRTYTAQIFLLFGYTALSLSPLAIIELGFLVLVATQAIRVAMLVWFYFVTQDYWFTSISIFILITLIYGFIWRS
ncbi:MAG: DUF1634 domain-containing protein [Gammaproteobacteria bacterium]|nr:DUF1634 domain-containing protein [Gammaproteobacteria bacterium]